MPDYYSIEVPMTPYPQKNHNRQWAAVALAAAGVFGMALVWVGVSGLAAERATHITYLTADIDVDEAPSHEPHHESHHHEVESPVHVEDDDETEDLMSDHISEDHHAAKDALLDDLMSEAPKEELLSDLMEEKESAEEELLSDHIQEDEAAKEEVLHEVMADDSKEELLSEHFEEASSKGEEHEHVAEDAAQDAHARDEILELVMHEEDPHEDELLSDHMQEDAPSHLEDVEDVEDLEADIVDDAHFLSDDLVSDAPKESVVEKKSDAPAATGFALFRERLTNRFTNIRNANLDLGASRGGTGIGAGIAVDKEGERTLSGSVSGTSKIADWKAGVQKSGDGPLVSTLDLSQEQHGSTFGLRFKKVADAALQWSGGIAHKRSWDSKVDSGDDATGAGGDPLVLTADVGTTKGDLKVSAGVKSTDGDLNLRAGVAGQSEANSWSLGIDTGSVDKPGNWKLKVGLGN